MIAKSHQVRVGEQSFNVFPSQPETVQALWSALPPDLRLALAKTAPPIVSPWAEYHGIWRRTIHRHGSVNLTIVCSIVPAKFRGIDGWEVPSGGWFADLSAAKSACDAALIAQGYVLDGETP